MHKGLLRYIKVFVCVNFIFVHAPLMPLNQHTNPRTDRHTPSCTDTLADIPAILANGFLCLAVGGAQGQGLGIGLPTCTLYHTHVRFLPALSC